MCLANIKTKKKSELPKEVICYKVFERRRYYTDWDKGTSVIKEYDKPMYFSPIFGHKEMEIGQTYRDTYEEKIHVSGCNSPYYKTGFHAYKIKPNKHILDGERLFVIVQVKLSNLTAYGEQDYRKIYVGRTMKLIKEVKPKEK